MKKNSLSLIIVTALSIYSSALLAACSSVDLAGTWQLYTDAHPVVRCIITVPSTSSTITGAPCYMIDKRTFTLSGKLAVGKDCHVTGQLSPKASETRTFDGWISKGKDSMSGMTWSPEHLDEDDDGVIFSAVKQ